MGLKLAEAPTEEPVTLDELKDQCRVFTSEEDADIARKGKAARRWCENYTFRQFVTATWVLTMRRFPRRFLLPRPPLVEVGSIVYVDADGAEATLAEERYRADATCEPAVIEPAYGLSWPAARPVSGAVTVEFDSGYGGAADVPEDIKAAILILAADLHLHREDTVTGTIVASTDIAKRLLRPYRCLAAQLEYAGMEAA